MNKRIIISSKSFYVFIFKFFPLEKHLRKVSLIFRRKKCFYMFFSMLFTKKTEKDNALSTNLSQMCN
jgi:hypothetical protein